jgi:hypothetical protein
MATVGTTTVDTVCEQCPRGRYKSGAGNVDCDPCPPGSYTDQTGQAACKPHTVCTPGQRVLTAPTGVSDAVCETCPSELTTRLGSESTCTVCREGKYMMNTMCVLCTCSGQGEFYTSCPAGSVQVGCTACTGGQNSGTTCSAGMEPAVRCDGTQLVDPLCANCPAGKQKPSSGVKYCEPCPKGTYKAAASNGNCPACTNKFREWSVYEDWGVGESRLTDACPWSCVAGYYKSAGGACVTCATAAGKYAVADTRVACSDCTNRPASNSYYQVPAAAGGFGATTNACPW